ncbi:MAG: hypothetical protein Q4D41_12530 [Prevotellaceae bacterium]|nr:hypothetical protein [Prevotellaceae bacterium]
MILFLFEGKQREPALYQTIQRIFFPKENQHIVCSFGNNIYELYKELQEYDGDGDLVAVLMDKFRDKDDNPFKGIKTASDFSEIYLFFDYDFHNRNLSLEEINREVSEMLEMFSDESENGKLYINYPMVESIRYTKYLPDAEYYSYKVTREQCRNFKHIASEFSDYNSFDYVQIDPRKKPTKEKLEQLRNNWQYLIEQNIVKANFICTGNRNIPDRKEDISQGIIFKEQLIKYVLTDCCSVPVLCAFPLFLYDYFK